MAAHMAAHPAVIKVDHRHIQLRPAVMAALHIQRHLPTNRPIAMVDHRHTRLLPAMAALHIPLHPAAMAVHHTPLPLLTSRIAMAAQWAVTTRNPVAMAAHRPIQLLLLHMSPTAMVHPVMVNQADHRRIQLLHMDRQTAMAAPIAMVAHRVMVSPVVAIMVAHHIQLLLRTSPHRMAARLIEID